MLNKKKILFITLRQKASLAQDGYAYNGADSFKSYDLNPHGHWYSEN